MLPFLRTKLDGAEAWRNAADRAVMAALEEAVAELSRRAAERARAEHPYTDRTGNLPASIGPRQTFVRGDRVEGGVEAQMPYASYIEEGTDNEDGSERIPPMPYLKPALDAVSADADTMVLDALTRALRDL